VDPTLDRRHVECPTAIKKFAIPDQTVRTAGEALGGRRGERGFDTGLTQGPPSDQPVTPNSRCPNASAMVTKSSAQPE